MPPKAHGHRHEPSGEDLVIYWLFALWCLVDVVLWGVLTARLHLRLKEAQDYISELENVPAKRARAHVQAVAAVDPPILDHDLETSRSTRDGASPGLGAAPPEHDYGSPLCSAKAFFEDGSAIGWNAIEDLGNDIKSAHKFLEVHVLDSVAGQQKIEVWVKECLGAPVRSHFTFTVKGPVRGSILFRQQNAPCAQPPLCLPELDSSSRPSNS